MIITKQIKDVIPSTEVIHSYEPDSVYCYYYTIKKQIVKNKIIKKTTDKLNFHFLIICKQNFKVINNQKLVTKFFRIFN